MVLSQPLDYETQSTYNFTVMADDNVNNKAVATVHVNVTNVDESQVIILLLYLYFQSE